MKYVFSELFSSFLFSSLLFFSAPLSSECEVVTPEIIKQRLENYLATPVPGLHATYMDVIDSIVERGHQVYVTGGVIRDLMDGKKVSPRDVDLVSSASTEDLLEIVNERGWVHTSIPEMSLFHVGDFVGHFIEIVPTTWVAESPEDMGFTVNSLLYHVNTGTFEDEREDLKEKIDDLIHNRIVIPTDNWNGWLYSYYGQFNYFKLYRFWKMVGKGYIYTKEQEDFFRKEAENIERSDPKTFNQFIKIYLSSHYDAYREIVAGARAIMGQKWSEEKIEILREELSKIHQHRIQLKFFNTHNELDMDR